MTISSTVRSAGPYTGNGVTASFPFAFKVFAPEDVVVVTTDTSDIEATLTYGYHFTVALNPNQDANPGGTITLTSALTSDYTLIVTSGMANVQPVDLTNQGGFYPKVINTALDRLTILIQQVAERVSGTPGAGALPPSANSDSMILVSTTLNVPSQYLTIQAALTSLANKRIGAGAIVTIQVADGTYNLTSGINLNHPDGDRIWLIGNQATPDNCVLMGPNPPTFNGLSCTNGNVFGLADGFKINLPAKAVLANNYSGIYAGTGAVILLGPNIKVNNWYYGINASYNAGILADYAQVSNAGDVGIWAFCGSQVQARYASSTGASDTVNGWGFGFQAEYGSQIECTGATATLCNIAGFAALSNSQVRAFNTVSSNNVGSGFLARDYGEIANHNATANNNTRYGEEWITGGYITGNGKTITGNTLGASNGCVYLDNGSLGARIAANGPMRLDTNGADPWYFNSSGGLQFSIGHTANAVNRWNVQGGATGAGLYLDALGSDTNISANVSAKGADVVRLRSNGKTAFQAFAGSASAVNYVQADASIAGSPVKLSAQGSDSVIDLQLFPKGAGSYVQLGAGWTSTGDVACNGYFPVKDNGGTVRKVMTTA